VTPNDTIATVKEQVSPTAGVIEEDKDTVPMNPFKLDTVTRAFPETPEFTATPVEGVDTVKSWTVNPTSMDLETEPPAPVTAIV